MKLKSAAYQELISEISDLEPVHGWNGASDLPELNGDDVLVVLSERQQDVSDETVIDTALISRLYLLDRSVADAAIGSHIRSCIELACREAIWPDVHSQCENNNEARYERQLARDYGVEELLS